MLPTDEQTPRPRSNIQARRKGPPASLRIETPAQKPAIALFQGDNSASTSAVSSATSESDASLPFSQSSKTRTMRNTKRLSLNLPSAHSNNSTTSFARVSDADSGNNTDVTQPPDIGNVRRRPSTLSLGTGSVASRLHRKDEDDSPSVPYVDGPIEIMPGVWLGSEDNARDQKDLVDRGIRSVLNVAKEVNSPYESLAGSQSLRSNMPAPELMAKDSDPLFISTKPHNGLPSMNYLKLHWSHGQSDLVRDGFNAAMAFVDAALERREGVLIHCQCGISRSATVVIALVMRAAALSLPTAPPDVQKLKNTGMSGAYAYVKEKSKWAGPNMSLIYQLLEYEKVLSSGDKSPSASEHSSAVAEEEEEWSRRRRLLDEVVDAAEQELESEEVIREAHALDKAMEERMVARKASGSSVGSSTGIGMGSAWKSRYGPRARAGSIASSSILSEDLVEENEEAELLGVGGAFDAPSIISTRSPSGETTEEEQNGSPDWKGEYTLPLTLPVATPSTARPFLLGKSRSLSDPKPFAPPPSAPATKTSFGLPQIPSFKLRFKPRPPPLNILPPVPSSPIVPASQEQEEPVKKAEPPRRRHPPPLRLNSEPVVKTRSSSRSSQFSQASVHTPSQTLFVFPPSPTLKAHTPLTMTLTSSLNVPQPFQPTPTPRVSTFNNGNRRRSFIGLTAPATPTTACSRVDARGWIGLGPKARQ